MKKTIAIVIGTRPEAIKLIPVYQQLLQSQYFEPIIISTGQHSELLSQVFQCLDIAPSEELQVMKHGDSLSGLTSRLFDSFDRVIGRINPQLIMVQGDTCSAWVASMVGFYHKIKIAHVEAGLRTGDKFNPFPEEVYRSQITRIADINFTPTKLASDNLNREGVSNIHQVGNTVVDMLQNSLAVTREGKEHYRDRIDRLGLASTRTVLITCHRRENIDKMSEIARAILSLAKLYPNLNFVIPVHLNPMVQHELAGNLADVENLHLTDPLPYDEFIYLLNVSHLVMTDSGGVQEEAASCDIPFIVLREKSERSEAVAAGCGIMGGTSLQSIIESFNMVYNQPELYESMKQAPNPFGDGNAAKRIVRILESEMAYQEDTRVESSNLVS